MTDGQVDREELRRLLEQLTGAPVGDAELDQLPAFLPEFGVTSEAELLEQLRTANDVLAAAKAVPDPVGDAFDAHVERLGDRWLDPEVLTAQSPGVRAVLVTRVVDGGVGNGGWVSMFVEGQQPVVRLAPEAYRSLGLAAFAALAERALEHGYDAARPDEAFWDALDAEWFALPDQEPARAAYVLAHPEEFAVTR